VKDLASLSDRLWLSPLFQEGAQNFKLIYLTILGSSGLQLQVKTSTGRRLGLDSGKAYGWPGAAALEVSINFLYSCEHANTSPEWRPEVWKKR
jgi:hypothetical protein